MNRHLKAQTGITVRNSHVSEFAEGGREQVTLAAIQPMARPAIYKRQ